MASDAPTLADNLVSRNQCSAQVLYTTLLVSLSQHYKYTITLEMLSLVDCER